MSDTLPTTLEDWIKLAQDTLNENDLGGYTIPTHGLYPFQWNWDSAITALGWQRFDEPRAWEEVKSLLSAQWDNGMVPHIVFHKDAPTYFPGPDVWGANRPIKSTSISQPPVLASVISRLYANGKDRALSERETRAVIPALLDYHLWWYQYRDPENTGLIVSYHPWESGMDNSPSWDKALAAVPEVHWDYHRRDTSHINQEERPHATEYNRYLYLVDFFKQHHFDEAYIYRHCPYKINEIGIISILHRGTYDLLELCETLGINDERMETLRERMVLTQANIHKLWNAETNMFHSRNCLTNELCEARVSGGLLPLFAHLANDEQVQAITPVVQHWLKSSGYAVSSAHPDEPTYEPQRYWRGPVWIHVNWMIAIGLAEHGLNPEADYIRQSSRDMVLKSGFNESFNAETGMRSGGSNFSWTAAIALHWLL